MLLFRCTWVTTILTVFPLFGKTVSTSKHKGGQEPMRNSLSCLNWSKSRLLRSHPAPATYFHPLPLANADIYRSRWWCAISGQQNPKQHITSGWEFSIWSILWTVLRSCTVPAPVQRRERGTQQLEIRSSLSFYETETWQRTGSSWVYPQLYKQLYALIKLQMRYISFPYSLLVHPKHMFSCWSEVSFISSNLFMTSS